MSRLGRGRGKGSLHIQPICPGKMRMVDGEVRWAQTRMVDGFIIEDIENLMETGTS
jgi:hypothetical protein